MPVDNEQLPKIPQEVSSDKAEWIEKQANDALAFAFESRTILAREAQTTLNWLFAISAGSGGYMIKLLADDKLEFWIGLPLLIASVAGAVCAGRLIKNAMMTTAVIGHGNSPKNLLISKFIAHELPTMRTLECVNLQERIELCRKRNHQVGDAINEARWCVAAIPPVSAVVGTLINLSLVYLG